MAPRHNGGLHLNGRRELLLGNAAAKTACPSTKSSIGTSWVRGSWKRSICLLSMRDGMVPTTINLENPDVTTSITWCRSRRRSATCNVAMSTVFR